MINLASTSDLIQVVTSHAAQIEVHASWVDLNGTTVTAGRTNTPHITTATTTTIVASPASSTVRNVKHLNITNDHASQCCIVTVEHTDGTTVEELMSFALLPGENMIFNEEGRWTHRDAQGAEYPPAGLGSYNGRTIGFMKSRNGSGRGWILVLHQQGRRLSRRMGTRYTGRQWPCNGRHAVCRLRVLSDC